MTRSLRATYGSLLYPYGQGTRNLPPYYEIRTVTTAESYVCP